MHKVQRFTEKTIIWRMDGQIQLQMSLVQMSLVQDKNLISYTLVLYYLNPPVHQTSPRNLTGISYQWLWRPGYTQIKKLTSEISIQKNLTYWLIPSRDIHD